MISFLLLLCILILNVEAQNVIPCPGNYDLLTTRWNWAIEEARHKALNDYWIIYTFKKMMPENSTIGHYYNGDNTGKTLEEILYPGRPVDYLKSLKGYTQNRSSKKVLKEVAFIFKMKNDKISDMDMSTIECFFKLQNLPVLWLGVSDTKESMARIKEIYDTVNSRETQKTLITAAGIHDEIPASFNFLTDIIKNDANNELREDAVFWIGQLQNPKVIPFLKETVLTDPDKDVAEKAVFSLHNINSVESLDAIIFFTKNGKKYIRKKAIFWLGQSAGKKAIEGLENIVFSDEETEIQKQAVFALSQLDNDQGIPKLIEIANKHPNPAIRKKAIFWLGESDDERALQALIKIVQKK